LELAWNALITSGLLRGHPAPLGLAAGDLTPRHHDVGVLEILFPTADELPGPDKDARTDRRHAVRLHVAANAVRADDLNIHRMGFLGKVTWEGERPREP
jgi:hypothetical protein